MHLFLYGGGVSAMYAEKTNEYIKEAIGKLTEHYGQSFKEIEGYPPFERCVHLKSESHLILLTCSFVTDQSHTNTIEGYDLSMEQRIEKALKDTELEKTLKLDMIFERGIQGSTDRFKFVAEAV
ncbi:hypothetical protein L4D15_01675 [Enterovibrio norvegicus]|uniref:hypothetical protein n=1 Tax=Enterovibrio norvegicus TaxID=188144 RepID=UPI003D0B4995